MIRRHPLRAKRRPSSWRKANRTSDDSKRKAERARITGAEFRTVYLEGIFKAQGCDICGRFRPPSQQHHVRSGGKGRKAGAFETVILCVRCHQMGHDQGFADVLARHGLTAEHLDYRAAEHASAAIAAGYLPVELCEECKAWHSVKFMLWELQASAAPGAFDTAHRWPFSERTGRRICVSCAPEGPR